MLSSILWCKDYKLVNKNYFYILMDHYIWLKRMRIGLLDNDNLSTKQIFMPNFSGKKKIMLPPHHNTIQHQIPCKCNV